ncbi:MAG: molybdenum ABC transporter ATP-binding protein [Rubrivivax sp.]|nr:molybdenum ABC transporter ATP-binding protein [Rubrivivax sp.]
MIEARLRLQRQGFTLDVTLSLPGRGVTALFGPSGCGKTSVLRALAGLDRAAGRVALGNSVWQDDAQQRFVPTHQRAIGYVIQEAALFPHLNVQQNLAYGLRRIAAAQRHVALDPVVDLLGLGHLLQRRPDTLSGGERQRVAIARALATSPALLLMDEPLAALDARRKAEVLPYLDRLHEELGIPIVYVSHAIDEVARLADHLVLLDSGHVLAAGPLPEMLARLDLPVALGEDAGVVLDACVGERDPAWHLARLDVDGPTCRLWTRDAGHALGRRVRLRVLARDVSLARTPQTGSSIANQLQATVEAIADDAHPALALVRVRVGSAPLVARLTRRSAHALELAVGMPVWAQVKTVALLE